MSPKESTQKEICYMTEKKNHKVSFFFPSKIQHSKYKKLGNREDQIVESF